MLVQQRKCSGIIISLFRVLTDKILIARNSTQLVNYARILSAKTQNLPKTYDLSQSYFLQAVQ